jgi:hypothetical protein
MFLLLLLLWVAAPVYALTVDRYLTRTIPNCGPSADLRYVRQWISG